MIDIYISGMCENCKRTDIYICHDENHRFKAGCRNEALCKAAAKYATENAPLTKWHPVADGLPEENGKYLAWHDYGGVSYVEFWNGKFNASESTGDKYAFDDVTAWAEVGEYKGAENAAN